MKIAVIGGGGVRSMFLAKSIAQKANALSIDELVFMDNNEQKLAVFGEMAKKISEMICPELSFVCTADPVKAIENADYIITTIRAGGDDMRVKDERIALNLGVLGQETTGAAGFSFAMRSIPALVEYCELAKKYAKRDVKIFNFTNPAGLVSQALRDLGYDFTFGICDAPSGMLHTFADILGCSSDEIKGEIYGLNHLSFFEKITVNGEDRISEMISDDRFYQSTDMRYFDKEFLKRKKFVPNEYVYYYFSREKAVRNIISADETRGEQIARINKCMIAELNNVDVENDFETALKIFEKYYGMRENSYMASETGISRNTEWKFDPFSIDEGGYAGVALNYIKIIQSGKSNSMILCAPNKGAIPILQDDDIVEMTFDITPYEVIPHKNFTFDEDALELIRRMKLYERKAAKAIINRDKSLAVDALMLHPLIESYTLAEELVEKYIELNEQYCMGWK